MPVLIIGLLASFYLGVGLAKAAGDVKRGSDVFAEQCAECHSVKEGKNKKGPSLFGIVGRPTACLPDFAYSDTLKQMAGQSWTAERIDGYVSQPKRFAPGGKMKYEGLPNLAERQDLIAYLASQH